MSTLKDIQHIVLDFSGVMSNKTISVKQGDVKSRFIEITPVLNNQALTLSADEKVELRCIKPDKKTVSYSVEYEEGKITVELKKQVLAASGNATADIVILGVNGEILSSAKFNIYISPAASNGNYLPSEDYYKRQSDVDMNGYTLKNVAEPVDDGDVVTKEYFDKNKPLLDNVANAVKHTVSGNPIVIDDASPVNHTLDIKTTAGAKVYIRGRNLIPFADKKYNGKYQAGQTYEMNGVNFTFNDDGSVYAKGTSTNAVILPLAYCSAYTKGIHTVTLSGSPEGSSATTYCLRLKNGTEATSNFDDYGKGKTINNVDLSGCSIYIIVIGGQTVDATFYPMLEFGNTVSAFVSPCESVSATADENGVVNNVKSVAPEISVFTNTNDTVECTYNCDTLTTINKAKEDVKQELNKIKEDITNFNYRLINTITVDSDTQLVAFLTDLDGNSLESKNLRKTFILFTGSFTNTTPSQPLCVLFNNGGAYQMYKPFNIIADNFCGLWFECEKIISLPDRTVYKSTYPSTLLGNFNADTGIAQGLNANNTALYSDLCVVNADKVQKITFGCFNSNNLMKSGSKIYLFGV